MLDLAPKFRYAPPITVGTSAPRVRATRFSEYQPNITMARDEISKPFPEFVTVNPGFLQGVVDSIRFAPDVTAGLVRQIPGVAGISEPLGKATSEFSRTVPGQLLENLGGFVGGTIQETFGAIGSRIVQLAGTSQDPSSIPLLNRQLMTLVLGETGRRIARGQIDFSEAPQDFWDSVHIAGIIPALKVLGVAGRAARVGEMGSLADFAYGYATPIRGGAVASRFLSEPLKDTLAKSAIERIGRLAGRATLITEGVGITTQAVLPHVAGDELWAREILDNRIIPESSPWRVPFEIGVSIPLDVVGLGKVAAESRVAAFASRKIHGIPETPMELRFGKETVQRGMSVGLLDEADYVYGNDKAMRDTALKSIYKGHNDLLGLKKGDEGYINKPSQLFASQDDMNFRIELQLQHLEKSLGLKKLYEEAANTMDDWEMIREVEPSKAFRVLHEFLPDAKAIELSFPGKVLGVDDLSGIKDAAIALEYLKTLKDWDLNIAKTFAATYPAFREVVLGAGGKFLTKQQVMDELAKEIAKSVGKGQTLPISIRLGALDATLDDLNRRVLKGENVFKQREAVGSEIRFLRQEQADDIEKQLDLLYAQKNARSEEVLMKGAKDRGALTVEAQKLDEQITKLTEDYFDARLVGTRWHVETPPKGPILRAIDLTGREYPFGYKTGLGKFLARLFGAIPNIRLGKEAHEFVKARFEEIGASADDYTNLMKQLALRVDESTWQIGAYKSSSAITIFHLEPTQINTVFKNFLKDIKDNPISPPAKYKSWAEVIYRAYPGPLKIFTGQVLGKELVDVPYNILLHSITRHWYPMVRFHLSPRFLALNIFEKDIIGSAVGGPQYFGEATERMIGMAQDLMYQAEGFGATGFLELESNALARQIARAATSIRSDELVWAVIKSLEDHPAMIGLIKSLGGREGFLKEIDRITKQRVALVEANTAETVAEQEMQNLFKELSAGAPKFKVVKGKPYGQKLLDESEIDRVHDRLTISNVSRQVREEAKKLNMANAKYQPIVEAVIFQERELIKNMRKIMLGNPERNAVERVLNSFLLYWPVSYQLKAGKLLLDFMFSKALGMPTGSSPAVIWGQLHDKIEKQMDTDPDWRDFFDKNKQLFFFLRNFIPMTPEDIGVTLSPFVRGPAHLFMGEEGLVRTLQRFNFGLSYDIDALGRIFGEQSKPGGLFYEMFKKE